MTFSEDLEQLSRFAPLAKLEEILRLPLQLLPESPIYVIPSIKIATDGLVLESLIVISKLYMCEVAVNNPPPPGRARFDYIAKNSIADYSFHTWVHEIKGGEGILKATFEMAEVTIFHSVGFNITTSMYYAGDNLSDWLTNLTEALPISLVQAR